MASNERYRDNIGTISTTEIRVLRMDVNVDPAYDPNNEFTEVHIYLNGQPISKMNAIKAHRMGILK